MFTIYTVSVTPNSLSHVEAREFLNNHRVRGTGACLSPEKVSQLVTSIDDKMKPPKTQLSVKLGEGLHKTVCYIDTLK